MAKIRNTSTSEVNLPKKGGGTVDIGPKGEASGEVDTNHPRYLGAVQAGVIEVGEAQQAKVLEKVGTKGTDAR